MIISIIGILIGALIIGFGLYYLIKEKADADSRKIYGISVGIGVVIFAAMLIKLLIEVL
ncbi:MAG: hypothetical protein LUE12_07635 [Ruminococcus sp.]|nr:hypothetical protein [Ruminococcus sp.]